jgi:hypothetical protein
MDLTLRTESFQTENHSWLGSAHGTDATQSITLDTSAFTANTHYPNGYFPSGLPLGKITATGRYGPYAGRTSEQQTITITGGPTGGTFTLSFAGETTAAIAFNATAAAVKTALAALASVNVTDLTTTGGALPGTPVVVTFGGRFSGDDVPQMTANSGSLTGGTSPTVTVTTGTGGATGAADGTEVLAGFLYTSIKAPALTTTDPNAAMYVHGGIREANLPIAVDSAAKRDVAGRIWFL